jgi:hypothetical protein
MKEGGQQRERAHAAAWAAGLLALLVGGICAGVLAGGGAVGAGDHESQWAVVAMTSPLFLTCAAIALGCALLAAWLGAALAAIGRRARWPGTAEGGAMVEFALVLPFLLMIVLLMVQSALLMGGQLCVNYAAFCAARSAVVQVPADFGRDEPPNAPGPRKMERVRLAALWAVLPVSDGGYEGQSADGRALRDGLERFFAAYGQDAPGWVDERLARKLAYAEQYTDVALSSEQTQDYPLYDETYTGFAANTDLRADVRHTLRLSVPFAARIFAAGDDGVRLPGGRYGMEMRTRCTLINQGRQDYVDVEIWE